MNWLSKSYGVAGRVLFGLALVGSGLLQLIRQDFVRHVPKLPAWVARPELWAVVSGVILVAAGLAIAVDRQRRPAAIIVAVLFFLVLLLYLPGLCANPGSGFMWTNPCKTLALLGTAILLATIPERWNPASGLRSVRQAQGHEGQAGRVFPRVDFINPSGGRVLPKTNTWATASGMDRAQLFCAICLGVFLVVCGVQHFVYVDFVVTLVPAWLPGLRFWAYFTGVALVAGGLGVNFRPTARLAAALSGLMIFLWVLLLHIPRAAAGWPEAFETAGIFEALALSGTGFLLAGVSSDRTAPAAQPGGVVPVLS